MRITRNQFLKESTILASKRGTCNRRNVGCIAVRDGRIVASGYNGAPSGLPHCSHNIERENNPRYGVYLGCQNAVHAEANLISYCSKYGIPLNGCDLWCTTSPCLACAQLIINCGFKLVVYLEEYRSGKGVEYLNQAGVLNHLFVE